MSPSKYHSNSKWSPCTAKYVDGLQMLNAWAMSEVRLYFENWYNKKNWK